MSWIRTVVCRAQTRRLLATGVASMWCIVVVVLGACASESSQVVGQGLSGGIYTSEHPIMKELGADFIEVTSAESEDEEENKVLSLAVTGRDAENTPVFWGDLQLDLSAIEREDIVEYQDHIANYFAKVLRDAAFGEGASRDDDTLYAAEVQGALLDMLIEAEKVESEPENNGASSADKDTVEAQSGVLARAFRTALTPLRNAAGQERNGRNDCADAAINYAAAAKGIWDCLKTADAACDFGTNVQPEELLVANSLGTTEGLGLKNAGPPKFSRRTLADAILCAAAEQPVCAVQGVTLAKTAAAAPLCCTGIRESCDVKHVVVNGLAHCSEDTGPPEAYTTVDLDGGTWQVRPMRGAVKQDDHPDGCNWRFDTTIREETSKEHTLVSRHGQAGACEQANRFYTNRQNAFRAAQTERAKLKISSGGESVRLFTRAEACVDNEGSMELLFVKTQEPESPPPNLPSNDACPGETLELIVSVGPTDFYGCPGADPEASNATMEWSVGTHAIVAVAGTMSYHPCRVTGDPYNNPYVPRMTYEGVTARYSDSLARVATAEPFHEILVPGRANACHDDDNPFTFRWGLRVEGVIERVDRRGGTGWVIENRDAPEILSVELSYTPDGRDKLFPINTR